MSLTPSKIQEISITAKIIIYAGAILGIIGTGLELWVLYQNNNKK